MAGVARLGSRSVEESPEERQADARHHGQEDAIEERDIILRVLSGEKDLYAGLVDRHGTYLYQLCLALLGNEHQAEEAAQVTLIKAYRSLASFKGMASFRTWVTRIALNHCRDLLRQRGRRRFVSLEAWLEEGKPLPEALVEEPGKDVQERKLPILTTEMLATLTKGERDLIELVGENLTYEQMRERLGLTLDGVKGRLKRARSKLRRFLKGV